MLILYIHVDVPNTVSSVGIEGKRSDHCSLGQCPDTCV